MIYCTYVLYLLLVTRKTPSGYTNSVCRNNMWVTDRRRQVRDLYTFAVVPGRVDRTFKMNPDWMWVTCLSCHSLTTVRHYGPQSRRVTSRHLPSLSPSFTVSRLQHGSNQVSPVSPGTLTSEYGFPTTRRVGLWPLRRLWVGAPEIPGIVPQTKSETHIFFRLRLNLRRPSLLFLLSRVVGNLLLVCSIPDTGGLLLLSQGTERHLHLLHQDSSGVFPGTYGPTPRPRIGPPFPLSDCVL